MRAFTEIALAMPNDGERGRNLLLNLSFCYGYSGAR
jgi:hypothetical protein